MSWKNIYKMFIICSFFSIKADQEKEWANGLLLFGKGELSAARQVISGLPEKGYGPWAVLGLIAEKEKDLPQALVAYSRAQRQAGILNVGDASSNMVRIRTELGQTSSDWFEYFKSVLFALWPIFFQLCILISWFIAMMLLRKRRRSYPKIILALSISFFAIILSRIQKMLLMQKHAVILEEASLHIGPSTSYQERKKVKPGSDVLVYETKDGWLKVKHEKDIGWLLKDVVEQIET